MHLGFRKPGHTAVIPRQQAPGDISSDFALEVEDYFGIFFDIATNADVEGPIAVCAGYPDSDDNGILDGTTDTSECDLEILHEESGVFQPRTAAIGDARCPFAQATCSHNLCIDTANNEICAKVSDASPFVVAIRTTAPSPGPRAVTVGYGTLDVTTGLPGVPSTITWSDRDVVLSGAFRDNVVNLGDNPFVTSPMSGSGWVSTPSGTPAGGAFGAYITSPGFSFDVFGFYTCPDAVGVCTSNGPDDDGHIRYDGYFSEAVVQNLSGPIMGPSTGQLPRYGSLGEEIVYTMDASSDCVVTPPSTVADCSGNIVLNVYSPPLPNTPVGNDVEVQIGTSFTHPDTGIDIPLDVAVTYDAVTSGGTTTVIPWSQAPGDMSDNFSVAVGQWQSVFFDVSTDASVTGGIVICTGYPDANHDGYVDGSYADECRVRVLHREAGVYQDRTLTAADARCPLESSPWCDGMCIDAVNNEICVGVDDLSMFTQVVLNEVPIADPGDDQVIHEIGTLVVLDGSKSTDPDGDDPITFAWTLLEKPLASLAELDDPSSPTPMLTPDVFGDYRFELVVTDALGKNSQPEQVLVSFENVPPVADAGDHQAVRVGNEVWLDGLRSYDPNGDDPLSLFYLWSFVSTPEGSAAVIADPGAPVTSFIADVPGIYVVELLVNDGELTSEPSTADITATTAESDLIDTLHYAIEVVNGLAPDDFTNRQLQKNMAKHLGQALALIDKGEYADARYKVEAEVRKTDGCAHEYVPDTNDWIDQCVAQEQVHPLLVQALALLDEILGG